MIMEEPHGLCHISEVIEWILTHPGENKIREGERIIRLDVLVKA